MATATNSPAGASAACPGGKTEAQQMDPRVREDDGMGVMDPRLREDDGMVSFPLPPSFLRRQESIPELTSTAQNIGRLIAPRRTECVHNPRHDIPGA